MPTSTATHESTASVQTGGRPRALSTRIGAVLASHSLLDAYAAIMPSSIVLLKARCDLTNEQTAWVLGVGPLFSGIAQPFAAWISDRTDSRLFTGIGLLGAGLAMCAVGYATDFLSLLAIYIPAMIATGAFHPVSAASVCELAGRRRSWAASAFFVAGMIGSSCGAFLAPRFLAKSGGFDQLVFFCIPAILVALVAYMGIAKQSHLRRGGASARLTSAARAGTRWLMIATLYVCAALRFSVNIALFFLYARWSELIVQGQHPEWSSIEVATEAGPQTGTLVSVTTVGMALGGILAGVLVRPGREKWPMVFVPILFAPAIWFLPSLPSSMVIFACLAAGIGYAAMIPVGIAVAQRLLPHRTGLASGLMMGGAWAVATVAPRLSEFGLAQFGLVSTFQAAAIALAVSGLLALPLQSRLVAASTGEDWA